MAGTIKDAFAQATPMKAPTPAVKQTVTEWAKDDPTNKLKPKMQEHMFRETTGVARATWTFIKDHPGCTRAEVIRQMVLANYNATSIQPLIRQFVIIKSIEQRGNQLFAASDAYKPLTHVRKMRAKQQAEEDKKAAKAAAKKAVKKNQKELPLQPAPQARAEMPSGSAIPWASLTAKDIVDNLPLREAMVLYRELKKLLEGGLVS